MLAQYADSPALSPARSRLPSETFVSLEAQITELWGHLNAATYPLPRARLPSSIATKRFERHGLVNSAQWLNWQCGIGTGAAREKVRTARALERLPEIAPSFERGEISYSKVRAMTRVATPANEDVLVERRAARHGVARREARAQVPVDAAAAMQLKDGASATSRARRALFLRRHGHARSERVSAARDRHARRARRSTRRPTRCARIPQRTAATRSARRFARRSDSVKRFRGTWPLVRREFTRRVSRRCAALVAESLPRERRGRDRSRLSSADRFQVVVHVDHGRADARAVERSTSASPIAASSTTARRSRSIRPAGSRCDCIARRASRRVERRASR